MNVGNKLIKVNVTYCDISAYRKGCQYFCSSVIKGIHGSKGSWSRRDKHLGKTKLICSFGSEAVEIFVDEHVDDILDQINN